jgi:pimeloyl-ACP methyl ester carboxylesterase
MRNRSELCWIGGPGGSGVNEVVQLAASFQQIIGSQFDVVGFDPRWDALLIFLPRTMFWFGVSSGVGQTTPSLRGFTDTEELMTFSLKVREDPPLGATPDSVARTYARFDSYGTVAATRLKGVGEFVSTPTVARDMLAIVKAHGLDKLNYWGISYGTMLGRYLQRMWHELGAD